MPWTGLLILVFVIFHLLQFTFLTIHPTPEHTGTVYSNIYYAFQKWWLVLIYVGAVVLLGFHILHGLLVRHAPRASTTRIATPSGGMRRPL